MAETPAEIAPWLVSGVVMVGLSVALLAAGPKRRPNLALALALSIHGIMELTAFGRWRFPEFAPDIARAFPAIWLPLAPAFLLFASVYPRERSWIPRTGWGMLPALGVVALMPVAYLLDDRTYWYRGPGVTFVATHFLHASYGLAAYAFARQALRRSARPSRRATLLLVSMAFALIHLYDAVRYVTRWRWELPPRDAAFLQWWLVFAGDLLSLAAYVPIVALVLRTMALRGHPARGAMRAFGAVVFLAAGSALFFDALTTFARIPYGAKDWMVAGLWDLSFPLLLAYAVLRHQLFGIELRLKWTIRQSTVSAAFVAAFFVVSETAQELFQVRLGTLYGILAAGSLAFAWMPLQRFAERVADRTMPQVQDTPTYRALRKRELYEVAVESTVRDGVVPSGERAMLERMRERIGLAKRDARAIERALTSARVATG